MIKEWSFSVGEKAVINANALNGLPSNVGDLIEIDEIIVTPTYEYRVRIGKDYTKVKEKELNKIKQDDPILKLKTNKEYIYKPTHSKIKILKIDYLYRQAEILHKDGSMEVVNADNLKGEN